MISLPLFYWEDSLYSEIISVIMNHLHDHQHNHYICLLISSPISTKQQVDELLW